MTTHYEVAIVGAGHGGAQAAVALRQHKFTGSVALIGDEPDLPYERPPLSKEYLSGEKTFDRLLIRPAGFWEERGITLLPGRMVTEVDPVARMARFADGGRFTYGQLIWAAGGIPRRLPGIPKDLAGVHYIRTRSDVDRLASELSETEHVVIIGGGYIGLEAAAVLVKLGKAVSLLEAQDRVLARTSGATLARFVEATHRRHGVDLRLASSIASIEHRDHRVDGVRLDSGDLLPAQIIIIGVGIAPAVGPLVSAGAISSGGVVVDQQCRTSLPGIFAVGDCASYRSDFAQGDLVRLESVQNATDQATIAAKAIVGLDVRYDSIPWFWSNQYDLRLQTIGLSVGYDQEIVRGDVASGSFSIIYLRHGAVVALDCVNMTRDFVQGRALVASKAKIAAALLARADLPLKEIALL